MISCEFTEISKNTFSYRTPPVTASVFNKHITLLQIISVFSLFVKEYELHEHKK